MENTNTERLQRPRYIKLVDANDKPFKAEKDRLMEHLHYPQRSLSNIGNVGLWLRKQTNMQEIVDEKDEPALVIEGGKLIRISKLDALKKGLFDMEVEVVNPIIRHRGIQGRVYVSLDGKKDLCVADIFNESESEEEYTGEEYSGTEMSSIFWATTDDTIQSRRLGLYVENDPKTLSDLNFRFEVIDDRGGGEIQIN